MANLWCLSFDLYPRRGLNPPHRVKSISMTTFTQQEIEFLQKHSNEVLHAWTHYSLCTYWGSSNIFSFLCSGLQTHLAGVVWWQELCGPRFPWTSESQRVSSGEIWEEKMVRSLWSDPASFGDTFLCSMLGFLFVHVSDELWDCAVSYNFKWHYCYCSAVKLFIFIQFLKFFNKFWWKPLWNQQITLNYKICTVPSQTSKRILNPHQTFTLSASSQTWNALEKKYIRIYWLLTQLLITVDEFTNCK